MAVLFSKVWLSLVQNYFVCHFSCSECVRSININMFWQCMVIFSFSFLFYFIDKREPVNFRVFLPNTAPLISILTLFIFATLIKAKRCNSKCFLTDLNQCEDCSSLWKNYALLLQNTMAAAFYKWEKKHTQKKHIKS